MPVPYKAKVVVASSVLSFTSACFGTVNRALPASTQPVPKFKEYVHLTMRNGDTLTLHNAAIRNDSIVGEHVNEQVTSNASYAAPVTNVQSYSANKMHKGRTILLVSVLLFTVIGIAGAGTAAVASTYTGY